MILHSSIMKRMILGRLLTSGQPRFLMELSPSHANSERAAWIMVLIYMTPKCSRVIFMDIAD